MDFTMLSSVLSAVLFVVFLAIVAWAYAARNRRRFEEASLLPFDDEDWIASGSRQPGQPAVARPINKRHPGGRVGK